MIRVAPFPCTLAYWIVNPEGIVVATFKNATRAEHSLVVFNTMKDDYQ